MYRTLSTLLVLVGTFLTAQLWLRGQTPAPQAQPPQIETTKVEGTTNVYTFRNGNSLSMFIVTNDGVIVTDPVGYGPADPLSGLQPPSLRSRCRRSGIQAGRRADHRTHESQRTSGRSQ
jgi:hypothetical protein